MISKAEEAREDYSRMLMKSSPKSVPNRLAQFASEIFKAKCMKTIIAKKNVISSLLALILSSIFIRCELFDPHTNVNHRVRRVGM